MGFTRESLWKKGWRRLLIRERRFLQKRLEKKSRFSRKNWKEKVPQNCSPLWIPPFPKPLPSF